MHLLFVHCYILLVLSIPWADEAFVRTSGRLCCRMPSIITFTKCIREAVSANPRRQLGDALRWVTFLVPWVVFAVYITVALAIRIGPLGAAEGIVLSLASLPFWRCICGRPVYLPYTILLRRRGCTRHA